jgi:DNA-binding IclR family transcriptional regulator
VDAVAQALRILASFCEDDRLDQSAEGISRRLGLTRSRVYRLLWTLEAQGFVRQDADTKRYRLGLKLLELGQALARQFDLARMAAPVLAELTEQTGETSYVYALDGLEAVTIAKQECSQPMRIVAEVGHRDTLHVGAACNLLLAYQPPEVIERVIGEAPLPRRTDKTVTDPETLKAELAEIRRLGYHLSQEEDQEGVDAIAAPIVDRTGRVIASVAIAGPSVRFTPEKIALFIPLVCNMARRISV